MKLSFIFPGQGSQYVGMGKRLFETYPLARQTYEDAKRILGFDVGEVSFNGPEEELVKTYITQPALLTHSVAGSLIVKDEGVLPDVVAGHSIGEYSALVASGALSFEDALKLTKLRGRLMWEVGTERPGAMAAVIGLASHQIEKICSEASSGGVVVPANFNSPGQVVISGDETCVEKACELVRSEGAKRTLKLNVSGAFHSPLMQDASDRLISELKDVKIGDPRVPVVVNCSAQPIDKGNALRDALERQLRSPVLWEQSMRTILKMGSTGFIEVGPGRVLKGILRRIDRDVTVHSLDEFSELKGLKAQLSAG